MKKLDKINYEIIATASIATVTTLAVFATTIYLTKPEKPSEKKKAPFMNRNIAHRGLFSKDQSVPENSLKAFELAVESGYGIELDVHITKDNEIVVFHDDTLTRVCRNDARVEECNWEEIQNLTLYKSTEKIPLLLEALKKINGHVPIILELKPDKRYKELCEYTYELIKDYNGDICIESFDPRIVTWFRKKAPDILRGQLAQPASEYKNSTSKLNAIILGNLLTNCISRPNFIAYKIGKKTLLLRLNHLLGAMKVAWTSHDTSTEKENDVVIFEHYMPERFINK